MNFLRLTLLIFLIPIYSILSAQTYEVGVQTFSFADPARGGRNVFGEVHYPATTPGNNVNIATGQFPLVIFGHGFGVNIDQYDAVYSEGLVREGYIVVYPETENGGIFSPPDHEEFVQDLSFLVDAFLAENASMGSFFSMALNTKTAIMGHSMGGGASFKAVSINPNVTAHASVAAANTEMPVSASSLDAAPNITVPSLMIIGAEDCVIDSLTTADMYQGLNSYYKAYAAIEGANHCNFGEAAGFSFCVTGEALSSCGNPLIPRADQHLYTLNLLKPFYDYWLKGDCAAWDTYQTYLTTATTHTYLQNRTEPTVASVTNSSATITFPALPGASMYTVTATPQGGGTAVTGMAATNSVTVSGLNPATTYDFEVTTDCGTGNSPYTIDCTDANTTCNMSASFTTAAGCAPTLTLNGPISMGSYDASIQITADGTVASPDNVTLSAGTCIDLQAPFEVQLGAEFLGQIQSCFSSETPTEDK